MLHEEQGHIHIYYNSRWDDEFKEVERFSVSYREGVYNLTITNTTVTDAGEYQCIEREGYGPMSTVSLNVHG